MAGAITSSSRLSRDENYDLKGTNQIAPDQIMPKGESPYNLNCRSYARNDGETRVAIRTRLGSVRLSTPVGETADVANTASATGDITITGATRIAQPFNLTSAGALTKFESSIKKAVGATNHVIVEIYTNVGGEPGILLAQGSIESSNITTSYSYVASYFIDAPSLNATDDYWVVHSIQSDGSGTYYLEQTAASGALTSSGGAWSALGASHRFKTYVSTVGGVKGYTKRYPQNATNRTLFAQGTNVYSVPDSPATPVSISSAINASATKVRFCQFNDQTLWCDGFNTPKTWDGTTVSAISGISDTPVLMVPHKQRLFYVPKEDPTRVNVSDLNDITNYSSVNFLYVPNPISQDHISGARVFQDNLVIFTHETKHIVYGSSLSTFERKEAIGTKGAVSDEAIAVDRNYIYFMADDGMIYRYNGVSDELISQKIELELRGITNKDSVRFHIYNNQLRVYYAKNPSTTVDSMALFDLETLQWFLDTGRVVAGSMEWTQDDNELIEFSSVVGAFYRGETGNSDLGKALDFKYWTAYKAYTSGAAKDRIKRFRPLLRTTGVTYTMSIGKDVDFENAPDMRDYEVTSGGITWGDGVSKWGDGVSKWGSAKFIDKPAGMSGRGKFTQYRFEMNGVDVPVELYGYISLIKSGRDR